MTHADTLHNREDYRVLFGLLRMIRGNEILVERIQVILEMMSDRMEAHEGPRPIQDVMKPILARTMREHANGHA